MLRPMRRVASNLGPAGIVVDGHSPVHRVVLSVGGPRPRIAYFQCRGERRCSHFDSTTRFSHEEKNLFNTALWLLPQRGKTV
jgi:hypothetical protein